jgi:hypothetical protein
VSAAQPIADWLAKIGLEQYAPVFADNDIDVSVLRTAYPCPRSDCSFARHASAPSRTDQASGRTFNSTHACQRVCCAGNKGGRGAGTCTVEQAEALGEPPEDPLLPVLYGVWVANFFTAFNGSLAPWLSRGRARRRRARAQGCARNRSSCHFDGRAVSRMGSRCVAQRKIRAGRCNHSGMQASATTAGIRLGRNIR